MDNNPILLKDIDAIMRQAGASRIIFKQLSNNDNSKQQIYLGTNFDVIQAIPTGETRSAGISKKGPIFKAPVNFSWISRDGSTERANGAQLILYPKYPEVRLSGILKGCSLAPSHLMQPPKPEERALRLNKARVLVLGIRDGKDGDVLAYLSSWDDALSGEVASLIKSNEWNDNTVTELRISYDVFAKDLHPPKNDYKASPVASVFYEAVTHEKDSRTLLLERLKEIYHLGEVLSQRMDKNGNIIPYNAQNGAGYTLESLFEIIPNGRSEPDFLDWELKSHSKGNPVTLMTPEPNSGAYLTDLLHFMKVYGRRTKVNRFDFTGLHKAGVENKTTKLTFTIIGYDTDKEEITNPDGGLFLLDRNGEIAAGWGFGKLIDHWKRKHAKTCFVSYAKENTCPPKYKFGPDVRLAIGANLTSFINAIVSQAIYYDPGVKMELTEQNWKPKKRNQFRIKWKDTKNLYEDVKDIDVSLL